jgi:iron-sulfur cluster assembly accessory protein
MSIVTLTSAAVKEIKNIIQSMPETTCVRVAIKGGGCSGYQYSFTLDENFDESKDNLIEQDGLKIIVDKRSVLYLEGTIVDFLEDLNKRGFAFHNPSAKTTCGCGSSFNVG